MGSRYLTDLPAWLREAGLTYVEYDGWQTRSRSSGGWDGDRPWCIMWHHTASQTSPENDANYMCHGSADRPLANLMLDRDGVVWILAAGATNTNGKGKSLSMSRGTIPQDSMNTHGLGVEACNSGVGEQWPQPQIDSYFKLNNILCSKLGLQPNDLSTHQFYAPDRKVDPATAAAVQGPWQPESVTSSGTWSVGDIRAEAVERAGTTPPPDPQPGPDPGPPTYPPEDDEMQRLTVAADSDGTWWVGDGITRKRIDSTQEFDNYVVLASQGCYTLVNTQGQVAKNHSHVQEVGQLTIDALGTVSG